MRPVLPILCLMLAACAAAPDPAPFPDADLTFDLTELDGQTFAARATIRFPAPDRVKGNGPCNTYSAPRTMTDPGFGLDGITATEMACDDLADEAVFFAALAEMTTIETSGELLILRNPAGRVMVFRVQA